MDLVKQLEDKKKELEQDKALGIGNRIYRLKAEIAILEQAIAEMQKQRQEEIEIVSRWKDVMRTWHIELLTIGLLCSEFDRVILKQLNQPKTENGCGRKFNDFVFGERICGRFEDLKHSEHIILCPECKKKEQKQ